MEELEGIKNLILERVETGESDISELAGYLSLDEEIIWKAVNSLRAEGKVFMPDEGVVRKV